MYKHHEALKNAVARPLWHDPDIMPEPLPPLSADQTCELLIVGGGFTGLWAAMQAKDSAAWASTTLILRRAIPGRVSPWQRSQES